MSIYSGFATRQQEQTYNTLALDLFEVLQRRLLKFYLGQEVNQHKFNTVLNTLYSHLAKMEQHKYLEPKFSHSIKQILALTNVVAEKESAKTAIQQNQQLSVPVPHSLNFSRTQIEQFKEASIGKIKHQQLRQNSKESSFLSRDRTNPEQINYRKPARRAASTYFPKSHRKGSHEPAKEVQEELTEEDRRVNNYMIREFVGRNKKWRIPRKHD